MYYKIYTGSRKHPLDKPFGYATIDTNKKRPKRSRDSRRREEKRKEKDNTNEEATSTI
jgi:hypothetical protein